jgi:glycosyltransferase involved in cell wall biosynthesis
VRDHYAAHGFDAARLMTIPNGIHWNGTPGSEPFSGGTPVIRACGRLVPQKGFEILVRAAAVLAAKGRDFKVEIVGGGPEREMLEREIAEAGVADRVRLLGERDDARRLIAECDVFALPSRREGLPIVILEGLHAGRPIVASDLACLQGVLADGETAVLVAPDSPEALARGLDHVLSDRGAAKAMARLGQEKARREFSIERAAASYIDVYERIMKERGL